MFFPVEKIEKLLGELRLAIHRELHPIPRWKFRQVCCAGRDRPEFQNEQQACYDDRDWADFTIGDQWGGYDVIAWFRATVTIPAHLQDKKLALRFLVGPKDGGNSTAETLLYVNGAPLQAIDRWHDEAWLPPEMLRDGQIHLALKAWSGVLDVPPHRHFRLAHLIWIDEPTERLYYLADTILNAAKQLDPNDLRRIELLRCVDQALRRVQFVKHRPEQFYVMEERGVTIPTAPVQFAQGQADLFYDSIADAAAWLQEQADRMRSVAANVPKIVGIGHSHIDLAWLWRAWHTREKAARTFSTVLHLMRQYPDYQFLHTSPQLYQWLQRDYPDLFERIREMIHAGRWEVTGGMWVEADTNIPNGESLVRQIMFGKRYFKDEFGAETRVLWLPDVFGYCWSLPQLMQRSGLQYFMTTKISWNQFNRFPYDTFIWRGIDGSEVLTHFVTTPEEGAHHLTYNGQMTPFEVKGIWDQYQQKAINDELILIYGWGDGGGGPTREMLESARALQHIPGLPRVELGQAEPYFQRLAERVADQDVPVWDGELYLEFHRGTYTSQAWIKRANRKAEVLYHDAEWLSALADVLLDQRNYPKEALREGWERLLFNQFHDILPGSSIREVYEDSRKDFREIERIGRGVVREAQGALLQQIRAERASVIVFNSLGWQRDGLIELPYDSGLVRNAAEAQVIERDGRQTLLARVEDVPSLGYRSYPLANRSADSAANELIVQADYLETPCYRITLNRSGQITSLYDKRYRREALAANTVGNLLQVFQDKPMAFDAWDIDIYYQDKMQRIEELIDATVLECGPLRGVLRLRWRFYDSLITQDLTIYAHSPRIDFKTEIEWHEQQMMLKVAFPIAVRATKATYEIQWGNIERPTHWNTSWDWARFEAPAHKWVDLSEGNYGVALLNDCKYGYDVKDNMLRLTLLRSPVRPDHTADKGRHEFTYSLLPHGGDWRAGQVAREAYDLNYPLHVATIRANPSGSLPAEFAFAEIDAAHVAIETIKRAEDDDAWIVRVYEYMQNRSDAVGLRLGRRIVRAVACNLMEEAESSVTVEGSRLVFAIAPYEIKTFKVWFES